MLISLRLVLQKCFSRFLKCSHNYVVIAVGETPANLNLGLREGVIKMRMNRKGFTLVEIMIVVAIIALLAAIAIPNLLRAKISANEAMAASTLRTLGTAAETYATASTGVYPGAETDLTSATPPYLNKPFCATSTAGFGFTCTWGTGGYTVIAAPNSASTGSTTFTVTTGGILTPPG